MWDQAAHHCKQFSRSASANLTISANTGITTQSLGLPQIVGAVVVVGVGVAVAASTLLLPAVGTSSDAFSNDAGIALKPEMPVMPTGCPLALVDGCSTKSSSAPDDVEMEGFIIVVVVVVGGGGAAAAAATSTAAVDVADEFFAIDDDDDVDDAALGCLSVFRLCCCSFRTIACFCHKCPCPSACRCMQSNC